MTARRLTARLALAAVAVAAVGVWYGFFRADPPPTADAGPPSPSAPPPDPRLTFATPFRNVRPEVRYLGDAACAGCHADIDRSYHAHPMGRSAGLVGRAEAVERYDPGANNPFTAGAFRVRVEQTGDRVVQRVTADAPAGSAPLEYAVTADLAIGSGTRGRSYLSVQGGAAWQAPASWFAPGARWDLSPGFEPTTRRAVIPECFQCHTDRVEPIPGAVNRYREPLFPVQVAIGCERCHGPGELHVAERSDGKTPAGVDTSIVNPRHLDPDLRSSVCRQCHLQGLDRVPRRGRDLFEFRPGLPWELFASVLVLGPELADSLRSVGQVEQMERSRCFAGSGGRLGCTSCHDPHGKPAPSDRARFYRDRCLTCHESKGCSLPVGERQARGNDCLACHMPQSDSANVAHQAVTDHRVPRRPTGPGAARPASRGAPFVLFRPGPYAPPPEERERDLGLLLARVASRGGLPAVARGSVRPAAEDRLRAAVEAWPRDAEAWGELASLAAARGDPDGMLAAARTAADLDPDAEVRLGQLVSAAIAAHQLDAASQAADRLVGMSPTSVDHRLTRADVALARGEWAAAEADCRAALALHPVSPPARMRLAVCRHRRGDVAGARVEIDTALRLADPRRREEYEDWYRRQTR